MLAAALRMYSNLHRHVSQVLRDSLGGNCKTVMVATMHPGPAHTDESISTCRFAQRVAKVTNVAEINEEVDQAALIERLKQESQSTVHPATLCTLPCIPWRIASHDHTVQHIALVVEPHAPCASRAGEPEAA